jgi:hypothetical protein
MHTELIFCVLRISMKPRLSFKPVVEHKFLADLHSASSEIFENMRLLLCILNILCNYVYFTLHRTESERAERFHKTSNILVKPIVC